MRVGLLRRLTGISFSEFTESVFTPAKKVIIPYDSLDLDAADTVYGARHSIIARIIFWGKVPSENARLDFYRRVMSSLDLGYEAVGFVDDEPRKFTSVIQGVKVLGNTTQIPEIVKKHNVDEAIITIANASSNDMLQCGQTLFIAFNIMNMLHLHRVLFPSKSNIDFATAIISVEAFGSMTNGMVGAMVFPSPW